MKKKGRRERNYFLFSFCYLIELELTDSQAERHLANRRNLKRTKKKQESKEVEEEEKISTILLFSFPSLPFFPLSSLPPSPFLSAPFSLSSPHRRLLLFQFI